MRLPCPRGFVQRIGSRRKHERAVRGERCDAVVASAFWPYLERTFASGRVPALATVISAGAHPDADQACYAGLDFLFDGIEARISG